MWPPDVRSDLRAAIKARRVGDIDTAGVYYQRSVTFASALSPSRTVGTGGLRNDDLHGTGQASLLYLQIKLVHLYSC